jgi:deoxyhypusine monooxygenase
MWNKLIIPCSFFQLLECMKNAEENDMVRHECAEALGSIATEDISKELAKYVVSLF